MTRTYRGLRIAVKIAAFTVWCTTPAAAEIVTGNASAPIQATATVADPLGLVPVSSQPLDTVGLIFEVGTQDRSRPLTHAFLAQFPSSSSLLVYVEADGRLVDRFALVNKHSSFDLLPVVKQPVAGARILRADALLRSVSAGTCACVVTLICADN